LRIKIEENPNEKYEWFLCFFHFQIFLIYNVGRMEYIERLISQKYNTFFYVFYSGMINCRLKISFHCFCLWSKVFSFIFLAIH
jgi:hypothetical protein